MDDSLDDSFDLTLDRFPDFSESLPRVLQLRSEGFRVVLHRELVVRDSIAEVQASGQGKVGFENEAELSEETFSSGRGVREEQASLGGIVDLFDVRQSALSEDESVLVKTNLLGRVHKLSNLQHRSPHRSSSSSDSRRTLPVVEQLVTDDRSSKTEQPKPDSSDDENASRRLV